MPRIHYSSRQHTQNAELEFIKPPSNPSFFPLRLSLFSFDCQLTFFSFSILEKMTFTIPRTVSSKLQTHRRPGNRFSFASPCLAMSFCCLKMNYFARFQPCHIWKFLLPSSNNTEQPAHTEVTNSSTHSIFSSHASCKLLMEREEFSCISLPELRWAHWLPQVYFLPLNVCTHTENLEYTTL